MIFWESCQFWAMCGITITAKVRLRLASCTNLSTKTMWMPFLDQRATSVSSLFCCCHCLAWTVQFKKCCCKSIKAAVTFWKTYCLETVLLWFSRWQNYCWFLWNQSVILFWAFRSSESPGFTPTTAVNMLPLWSRTNMGFVVKERLSIFMSFCSRKVKSVFNGFFLTI